MTPRSFSFAAALVGAVLMAVGVLVDPRQAWFSYLTAYLSVLTVVLGGVALVMIAHLSGGSWLVAVSRKADAMLAMMPLVALLSLPLAAGVRWYAWTDLSSLPAPAQELVARKLGYLNVPFFLARAVFYLLSWCVLSLMLRRLTPRTGDVWTSPRLRALSAAGAIVFAFTLSFASFDWVMSLTPQWSSSIFGVRVFSAAMVGAVAALALWIAFGDDRAPSAETSHTLGLLQLAFIVFWGYIAFSQLLIIWIADTPREITWYLPRLRTSWRVIGVVLVIGHFAVPLSLLILRSITCHPKRLALLSLWLLVMHYVDVYWLVMPAAHPAAPQPHWLDAAALAMLIGVTGAAALRAPSPRRAGLPMIAGSITAEEG